MAFFQCQFKSEVLEMNMHFNVLMPNDRHENEQFKVLYLLHGYIGDHYDWIKLSSLERYLFEHRLMVVMPSIHNSYYTNMAYGLDYFDFVAVELPQFIKKTFPVSDLKEDTFVAGLSMGGYGALKMALTYPESFGKAASLSGVTDLESIRKITENQDRHKHFIGVFGNQSTKGTSSDLTWLIEQLLKEKKDMPKLFLACGTEDFLYEDNVTFHQYLDNHQISHTYLISEGDHNWAYWDKHIQDVLAWLKK